MGFWKRETDLRLKALEARVDLLSKRVGTLCVKSTDDSYGDWRGRRPKYEYVPTSQVIHFILKTQLLPQKRS